MDILGVVFVVLLVGFFLVIFVLEMLDKRKRKLTPVEHEKQNQKNSKRKDAVRRLSNIAKLAGILGEASEEQLRTAARSLSVTHDEMPMLETFFSKDLLPTPSTSVKRAEHELGELFGTVKRWVPKMQGNNDPRLLEALNFLGFYAMHSGISLESFIKRQSKIQHKIKERFGVPANDVSETITTLAFQRFNGKTDDVEALADTARMTSNVMKLGGLMGDKEFMSIDKASEFLNLDDDIPPLLPPFLKYDSSTPAPTIEIGEYELKHMFQALRIKLPDLRVLPVSCGGDDETIAGCVAFLRQFASDSNLPPDLFSTEFTEFQKTVNAHYSSES